MNKYLNNKDSINIIKNLSSIEQKKFKYNKPIDNNTLNVLFDLQVKLKTSINNIYLNSNNSINRVINNTDFLKNTELINSLNSKYVSNNIKKYIFSNSKKQIVYTYKNNLTYIVNFITFTDKIDTLYLKYLDMCACNVFSIIDFLETYRKNNCYIKNLELYIFLTDFKKQLPQSKSYIIGPENVNTGLTSPCRETTKIIIYRKEEFMKLVVHELIHALGLDIPNNLYTIYTTKLDNFFGIESTYNFNESYTELWALLINILFIIAINNKDSMDKNSIKKLIHEMLYKEIIFSSLQVTKILDFMSLSLNDLRDSKKNHNFKENTHAFCYYIIKYILLYNITDFINISGENINFSLHISNDNDIKKLNKILGLILSLFNNKKFITDFNEIESYFKIHLSSDKNSLINKTLRMTSIELA